MPTPSTRRTYLHRHIVHPRLSTKRSCGCSPRYPLPSVKPLKMATNQTLGFPRNARRSSLRNLSSDPRYAPNWVLNGPSGLLFLSTSGYRSSASLSPSNCLRCGLYATSSTTVSRISRCLGVSVGLPFSERLFPHHPMASNLGVKSKCTWIFLQVTHSRVCPAVRSMRLARLEKFIGPFYADGARHVSKRRRSM